jgi:hypothetical protein
MTVANDKRSYQYIFERVGSCGYDFEPVEIVAILFGSDEDRESFEKVLWPHRAAQGVEIC